SESDELEELQEQIQRLKGPPEQKSEGGQMAGMGLVFSLGFTVLGALMAGDHFGRYLSEKAGNPQYSMVGWGLGLGLALVGAYFLLRPYLKQQ
ncbi:MAG: hypothetical protein KIS61_14560, partial [Candidatus Eremiobacteraeota bacterium]|nr:hypothetical protein [Candidatus Eremiobacteraeota bacterium]